MLAYILAIAVALGSLSLYTAAFLLPEVHRKYDLVWSGVGLFYGLVLWVCAGRITGGVLLGQIASVSLIGWFGWQTLEMRFDQAVAPKFDRPSKAPDALNQLSLAQTVQQRIAQYRLRLRQNPETSSVLVNLDRLLDNGGAALNRLRIWAGALMSTAISNPIETSESAPPVPPPVATVHPPEVIEPSRPEAAAVRIEVEGFAPDLPPSVTPEPAAEWSDLEFDSDPDMETIDGSVDSVSEERGR